VLSRLPQGRKSHATHTGISRTRRQRGEPVRQIINTTRVSRVRLGAWLGKRRPAVTLAGLTPVGLCPRDGGHACEGPGAARFFRHTRAISQVYSVSATNRTRSIVMLSAGLSVRVSGINGPNFANFCACCLCSWFLALRYVMYFRCRG